MACLCTPRRYNFGVVLRLLGLFSVLCAGVRADAAVKRWTNMFGGAFNAAANWSGGIPGSGDIAEFGVATLFTPGTYIVTFDVSPTNQAIHVEDDLVTFDLNGRTYTTTAATGNEIGTVAGQSGRLTITDGIWNLPIVSGVSRVVDIGAVAGASGTLVVSMGGQITGNPDLVVGADGAGTLTVQNNGDILAKTTAIGFASAGTAMITGAGSTLVNSSGLSVGVNGTMAISLGGFVQNTDAVVSGGTVTVSDFNSRWNNTQELFLSGIGSQLTITNGGRVDSTNGYVGFADAGHATVGDANPGILVSQWIMAGLNGGTLAVGASKLAVPGSGTLDILTNGRVQNIEGLVATGANSTGQVTLSSPSAQWLNSGALTVGQGGDGTLHIAAGVVQNVNATVGDKAGSAGTVIVDGQDSQWISSGELSIGRDGNGTLEITSGGRVQNSADAYLGRSSGSGGGSGAVTVRGPGSTWTNNARIVVGQDSDGSLSIEAGGSVTTITGIVGEVVGSHGTATVDGPGSTWTTSGVLAVSNGTLTIANGGVVTTNGLFGTLGAATMSNAQVTVVGQGSRWNLSSALLTLGFSGTATLNILAGGNVANLDARIAVEVGSTGTANVSGAGSTWTIGGRLGVGGNAATLVSGGTGTLNIQPGAKVNVAQNIVIFPNGLLRLEGGTLDASTVSFQGGGQFEFTSGTLHVGTFNGNLTNQGGTLAPGHSAGTTNIVGSYAQQSGATLKIEVGGTAPGTFDVVNVTGIAGMSGQLQLALLAGFVPGASDTFTVLGAAGGIFGSFANVATGQRLGTIDGVGSFQVNYGVGSANPNQIILTGFQSNPLPGDNNFDGKVDAADYVVWRKNDGSQSGYDRWRSHFGQTLGSAAAASRFGGAAVPEPESLPLLLGGVILLAVTAPRWAAVRAASRQTR
jgi:fibronectin-binding autotransporter adhesin